MLTTGDFVFDIIEKVNVKILEEIEAWGYVSYKVFNPSTGRVYKATEEQLSSTGSNTQYDENYLRYVVLLSKIKNETADGFLSSLASGIIPLPHQLHVLNRAMENNNIRYILADEVGLENNRSRYDYSRIKKPWPRKQNFSRLPDRFGYSMVF